ncbi:uncharacterized protein Bfra_003114 [Botrytis fragariae]|uniref:Mid2 domain-containing protein n=1 Tax=Botrytis fragariae TaxID=1964551 RepID=A0A8H6ELK9_9HELO|nr:uncharacterized protein Bfra_003114 [Botrytis fragariae]KAF5876708.1 hypothetical protein Bfra_003114 [Botrytis fragariae]
MVTIVIWQNGKPPYQYLPNSVQIPNLVNSYTWIIDISGTNGNPGFDLNNGSTFYFIITHTGTPDLFASQSINITNKAISSSATSSPSLAIEATSTASVLTAASSTSSSAASPATTSSELSTGAKVGIGVGVTLCVVAIVAAFALGYFFRRPSKSPSTHIMNTRPRDESAEPKPFGWQPPQELSSSAPRPKPFVPQPPQELSSKSTRSKPKGPIFEIQG